MRVRAWRGLTRRSRLVSSPVRVHTAARTAVLVGTLVAAISLAGCTATPQSHHTAVAGPTATVSGLPASVTVRVHDDGHGPALPGKGLNVASDTFAITPTGPLPTAATVTIPLHRALRHGTPVVAARRPEASAPWTYLPATLSRDGRSATFPTTDLGQTRIVSIDLDEAVRVFESQFHSDVDGAVTATSAAPTCTSEQQARADGYHVTASAGNAVSWCLGLDASGTRVLTVVNNLKYPLDVQHTNMGIIANGSDPVQLAALTGRVPAGITVILPTGTATFNANLPGGDHEGIRAQIGADGQSVYAVQTTVAALRQLLSVIGVAAGQTTTAAITGTVLTRASCTAALGTDAGSAVRACFDADGLRGAFGNAGVLLAPVVAAPSLTPFLSDASTTVSAQASAQGTYQIAITRDKPAVVPLLGMPWGPYQVGFGTVRPHSVFNGGDPTGAFTIDWDSWGGPTADGHGTALWVAPDGIVADGVTEPARFRAYDLGTCQGKLVYLHLAVWFPQHGETFDPPNTGETGYTLCPGAN